MSKEIIETIVNTCALAITAAGTTFVMDKDYYGFILIGFGMLIEWFKYWGRSRKLW